MNKRMLLMLALLSTQVFQAFGAPDNRNWLDDTFFQDGKYKVVIVILSIIFVGIMIFVGILERRVKKLENINREELNSNTQDHLLSEE